MVFVSADIEVTVGGQKFKPSAFTPPKVTAPPDQDCVGDWAKCIAVSKKKQRVVTIVHSGSGKVCGATHGASMACSAPSLAKSAGGTVGAAVSALMLVVAAVVNSLV